MKGIKENVTDGKKSKEEKKKHARTGVRAIHAGLQDMQDMQDIQAEQSFKTRPAQAKLTENVWSCHQNQCTPLASTCGAASSYRRSCSILGMCHHKQWSCGEQWHLQSTPQTLVWPPSVPSSFVARRHECLTMDYHHHRSTKMSLWRSDRCTHRKGT